MKKSVIFFLIFFFFLSGCGSSEPEIEEEIVEEDPVEKEEVSIIEYDLDFLTSLFGKTEEEVTLLFNEDPSYTGTSGDPDVMLFYENNKIAIQFQNYQVERMVLLKDIKIMDFIFTGKTTGEEILSHFGIPFSEGYYDEDTYYYFYLYQEGGLCFYLAPEIEELPAWVEVLKLE